MEEHLEGRNDTTPKPSGWWIYEHQPHRKSPNQDYKGRHPATSLKNEELDSTKT